MLFKRKNKANLPGSFGFVKRWSAPYLLLILLLIFGLLLLSFGLHLPTIYPRLMGGQLMGLFQSTEKFNIQLNGFSPDNHFLSFDFYSGPTHYATLLDLHSGEFSKIVPPDPDEGWIDGYFSPSGKFLAFAVTRKSENFRWANLGLFDISTGTLKILSHTQTQKGYPSFSPDEKRLIYAQANRERESGRTKFAAWDIYELDIDSGQSRQLTDYEFFSIGQPFYLPDGKRFIFSGEAPTYSTSSQHSHGVRTLKDYENTRHDRDEYEKQYQENTIFILGQEAMELRPILINGQYTVSPGISKDGKRIAYVARSNHLDKEAGLPPTRGFGYDIFILEDGHHRRLTKLKTYLHGMKMSSDGSLIAFVSDPERNGENQLWILDVPRNRLKRIEIAANVFFQKATNLQID